MKAHVPTHCPSSTARYPIHGFLNPCFRYKSAVEFMTCVAISGKSSINLAVTPCSVISISSNFAFLVSNEEGLVLSVDDESSGFVDKQDAGLFAGDEVCGPPCFGQSGRCDDISPVQLPGDGRGGDQNHAGVFLDDGPGENVGTMRT